MSKPFEMCFNCHTYLDERDSTFCSLCGERIKLDVDMVRGGMDADDHCGVYGDFYDTVVRMSVILKEKTDLELSLIIKSNSLVYRTALQHINSHGIQEIDNIMKIPGVEQWVIIKEEKDILILSNGYNELKTGVLTLVSW